MIKPLIDKLIGLLGSRWGDTEERNGFTVY